MDYLVARHYVGGDEESREGLIRELERGTKGLLSAKGLLESESVPTEVGLKLTVDGNSVKKDSRKKVAEMCIELEEAGILFDYDCKNRGAGTSLRQILFNPRFQNMGDEVVMCFDLDQYVVGESNALNRIRRIAKRVASEDCLFTCGSRNKRVRLGFNNRPSELRIIHEMMISLAIGQDNLHATNDGQYDVHPAYAKFGECTSGFYFMNVSHQKFPTLQRRVVGASMRLDMRGFSTDYYLALASAEDRKGVNGYVESEANYYGRKPEEDETAAALKLIRGSSRILAQTDASEMLRKSIYNPDTVRDLSKYFPRQDVALVRQTMVKAFENS